MAARSALRDDRWMKLFAIAAPGLEPVVARELERLGERPRVEDGGVSWEGDALSLMRANLWLRAASRVIVRVAAFRATAFFELEKQAKRIEWGTFISPGTPAAFRVTSRKSRLYHSDAIAERLIGASGARIVKVVKVVKVVKAAKAEEAEAAVETAQLFIVRVVRDQFEISADSSGALLHMRGYRQAVGKAPLRETLAAALLLAAGYDGSHALLDPMCGSGTIPIEGALIARGIAPGLHREFAFMRWPGFDVAGWNRLVADARSAQRPRASAPILGSDRDSGAVAAAAANAVRAGVTDDVRFERLPVSAIAAPAGGGLVATNPPYGMRIGEPESVRNLYAALGRTLASGFSGWRVALFSTGNRLASQLGLPLERDFSTTNGGIPVVALMGEVP